MKIKALFICIAWPLVMSFAQAGVSPPTATRPYEVRVMGGDESSFYPQAAPVSAQDEREPCNGHPCDAVVIGGGLAGLSAGIYLTDNGKRVMIVEKETHMGGLAAASVSGVKYDRGAAYWTDAYREEAEILKRIGLGDYEKHDIPEPIDSYLWRGKLYLGIWETETLEKLPGNFALFKYELQMADILGQIPNQPFEEAADLSLDRYTARGWMEEMPALLRADVEILEKAMRAAGKKIHLTPAEIRRLAQDAAVPAARRTHLEKLLAYVNSDDMRAGKVVDKTRTVESLLSRGTEILQRFERERAGLRGRTGMEEAVELMDMYCRSALGAIPGFVSAVAFANFYISEITVRYTTKYGTGIAANNMVGMLARAKNREGEKLATMILRATVTKIRNTADGVEVTFQKDGKVRRVSAKYAVFAAQLKLAPKLIEGFAANPKSRAQARMMTDLGYSHYSVHAVHVKGHPYRSTYDTWTRAADYTHEDFSDVILGRWVDLEGYKDMRDFSKDPADDRGVLTIYHPLTSQWMTQNFTGYTDDVAVGLAERAVKRLEEVFSVLPPEVWKGPLEIRKVETSRWPFSVHVAASGHFQPERVKTLRRPYGNVFFANNNMGTPSFEEALFRGHCAADNIVARMDKAFKREEWSSCPCDLASERDCRKQGFVKAN